MRFLEKDGSRVLVLATVAAALAFAVLYQSSLVPIETPPEAAPASALADWEVSQSDMNGAPLEEDKSIYEDNANIYDVYISVFPTKDGDGNMLDFSDFSLHSARNHDYDPRLNCNIQILPEGKTPDPLLDLDSKNATIQVRGNSARGESYKSYRVRLSDEAGTFFGQKVLNINKHSKDVSKISTKLETDLLAQVENSASYRTYFMRLWIRDASKPEDKQEFEYNGLYTEIEQPNKTYLEAHGLSSNAVMYKARDFSFAMDKRLLNVDDPGYSEKEFETVLGIREGKDHKKLLEMLEAVNDTTREFEDIFQTYFDEENYLTWLAFQLLVGNFDILNHNFIIYSLENSQTWYFIPWDFDDTLKFGNHPGHVYPVSLRSFQKLNMGVLHRRYFRMEGSLEKLDDKMQELLNTAVTRERVTELTESYKSVLEKTMMIDPDVGLLRMQPNDLFPYIDSLYDGILSNYEAFKEAQEYPAPMFVAQPERLPDGSVKFSWDPSYSYQGRPITYSVRLYEDYNMEKLILDQTDIVQTNWTTDKKLEDGIYYLLVSAKDNEGNEQLSLEHVEGYGHYIDGLLEFTLD